MKNTRKNSIRENQLKSNSSLFLQLGILLALILVYNILELKFSKKVLNLPEKSVLIDEPDVFVFPPFEFENTEAVKEKTEQKLAKLLTEIEIVKTESKSEPEDFIFINLQPPIDFDSIFSDIPLVEEPLERESIPFIIVEQSPRFPGCKEKTEADFKKCFNEKMNRFISKNFNPNLDLNLSGKQRVDIQFEIDAHGDIINIKARAAHKRLEKEAIKVIHKLPKMEPGKQRNRKVGVKYVLPISVHF